MRSFPLERRIPVAAFSAGRFDFSRGRWVRMGFLGEDFRVCGGNCERMFYPGKAVPESRKNG
jgi:hypothetical protein